MYVCMYVCMYEYIVMYERFLQALAGVSLLLLLRNESAIQRGDFGILVQGCRYDYSVWCVFLFRLHNNFSFLARASHLLREKEDRSVLYIRLHLLLYC